MDLFTHILFAYLLTFAIWGPTYPTYIAAGALAGALPDADILLYPLSRRFPIFRHHGITHSLLGVTIIALGGAILGPYLVPGLNGYLTFLAMEGGGLSHVFLDGFTHFSVPPLAPFSTKELRLDADRAVNFATMTMTLLSFFVLISERGAVPLHVWIVTAWVLVGVYGAYLVIRGAGRIQVQRLRRRDGYGGVIPTGNPRRWILVDESPGPGHYRIRWREYRWGTGYTTPERALDVEAPPEIRPGPVETEGEALARSLPSIGKASRFLADSYRFAEVSRDERGYEVFWYSLEFTTFGRAPGVLARVDAATGDVAVRTVWRSPRGT